VAGAAEIDLENTDPAAVYAAITEMDEAAFERLMSDPRRRSIVIESLVQHMADLFRPEKAGDLEAVIHVKLWDRPGGGYDHAELVIADGACRASAEPEQEADITLKIRPLDLRKLVAGETGPRRLVLKRRMTVLGDIRLATKLPDLFRFG
jgi:putative sterol carrier protein